MHVHRLQGRSIHTYINSHQHRPQKKTENSLPLSRTIRVHPSGVGLQVDLPYGRSILQVDHPKEQAFEQKQVSEMSPCQS